MKAVITVVGRDSVGIIAKVSTLCTEYHANIVDIDSLTVPFTSFVDVLAELGKNTGLDVRTMHEDVFNSMHRI